MAKDAKEEQLLTAEQVAEWLQISPRSLERWRDARKGPQFRKIGGLIRYTRKDVELWIDGQTVKTDVPLV